MQLVVNGVEGTLWQIVFFTQMRQHHMLGAAANEITQRLRAGVVGEMAVIRCDAPFQHRWIRTGAQHLTIMVGLQQQHIAVVQRLQIIL